MQLGMARAVSRAAYPCPLTRRIGDAAGAVENHCPVGSIGLPMSCRGQTADVLVLNILACSLQRLVTLSDYSLPGRFISDCICFSRQCPSIIRFPLTPCLHARGDAEIRNRQIDRTVRSDHGTSCCRCLCPRHTCRTFLHTTRKRHCRPHALNKRRT